MLNEASSTIYPRFAVLSFLVVAALVGTFTFIAYQLIAASQSESAAQGIGSSIARPLVSALVSAPADAPLPTAARASFDDLTQSLGTDGVRALRVWGPDGRPVLASGPVAPPAHASTPGGGVTSTRARAADGTPLFVTWVRAGAYGIEIDQDAAAIDAAIARARSSLIVLVTLLTIGGYLALQVAFWIGVRRFAAGHRRMSYLYRRGDEIRASLDLQEVATHVSRDAARLARGRYGLVALFDETVGDLVLQATYDAVTGVAAEHRRPIEEWFLRRAIATRTSVVTSQPASVYRQFFGADIDLSGQVGVLCVPMLLRDRTVGVVAVMRPAVGRISAFTRTDASQVEELAAQAVTAVEQALLFAKVRGYADEIEVSYDATLKALMAALDAKDEVTEGHCERVARLTLHLAREMGLPDEQMLDIERGALLHDVGKIGVPDAVLKKPKALNDLEWEAMRKHPLLAGLMVSKIGFLEKSMPILLYHHERYDGTGYPFGLAGESIPLEARIFSIVDAYDAMTSDRPYRDAMPHDVAMADIEANTRAQFDPSVVTAFKRLMSSRPELRHTTPHRMVTEHDDHDLPPAIGETAA
ncbi:MAG TPA: HD domain-containing phosphohydrolase [Dehalococcoidia bacterium]|nr:HD domain-containing phosphohydrolase [Dehalococcoidia bacterium]